MVPEHLWESMTEPEKTKAVRQGQATLEQMRRGVLEGPNNLRRACREVLARTITNKTQLPSTQIEPRNEQANTENTERKLNDKPSTARLQKNRTTGLQPGKQRFGLPKGFVPRPQREQANILIANNVYRLPNGTEVVPCHPTGTLGRLHHLYALVTVDQFQRGARGSTYVRTDGRIFDYSVDDIASGREMFDTGLTLRVLERTGNYVSSVKSSAASQHQK